ncbi:unnamed protein product [Linum trigynum]|uniref:UBN2 domain-containing protein n=1 Tax=Linum trigynum TaxID=586398 RepID=A0AAV2G5B6_9ROSI
MIVFFKGMGFDVWNVVENSVGDIKDDPNTWSNDDLKKMELDAKATNVLYCAICPDEFNKVNMCKTAHQIWKTLEVSHEGTTEVKESMIYQLVHEY